MTPLASILHQKDLLSRSTDPITGSPAVTVQPPALSLSGAAPLSTSFTNLPTSVSPLTGMSLFPYSSQVSTSLLNPTTPSTSTSVGAPLFSSTVLTESPYAQLLTNPLGTSVAAKKLAEKTALIDQELKSIMQQTTDIEIRKKQLKESQMSPSMTLGSFADSVTKIEQDINLQDAMLQLRKT